MKNFLETMSGFGITYMIVILFLGIMGVIGMMVYEEFSPSRKPKAKGNGERQQRFEKMILVILFVPAILTVGTTALLVLEEPLQPIYLNVQNGIQK